MSLYNGGSFKPKEEIMSKTIRKEYKGEGKKPSMFEAKKSPHDARKELAMIRRKS